VIAGLPTAPVPASRLREDGLRATLTRTQANPSQWLALREAVFAADGSDERIFIQDYSMELRLAALFSPAVVDAPLVAMPVELEAGRLSGNQQQVMYDGCLSIAHFLEDGGTLPEDLARHALRRNAERAWKWAHRRAGQTPLSPAFSHFAAARLGLAAPQAAAFRQICSVYAGLQPIRRTPTLSFKGLAARQAALSPAP
jgi:hypothetical protein